MPKNLTNTIGSQYSGTKSGSVRPNGRKRSDENNISYRRSFLCKYNKSHISPKTIAQVRYAYINFN
jgi:hypothetical protein